MSNFNFEYGPKWIEENGLYTFVVSNTEKSPVIEVKSDFSFFSFKYESYILFIFSLNTNFIF